MDIELGQGDGRGVLAPIIGASRRLGIRTVSTVHGPGHVLEQHEVTVVVSVLIDDCWSAVAGNGQDCQSEREWLLSNIDISELLKFIKTADQSFQSC